MTCSSRNAAHAHPDTVCQLAWLSPWRLGICRWGWRSHPLELAVFPFSHSPCPTWFVVWTAFRVLLCPFVMYCWSSQVNRELKWREMRNLAKILWLTIRASKYYYECISWLQNLIVKAKPLLASCGKIEFECQVVHLTLHTYIHSSWINVHCKPVSVILVWGGGAKRIVNLLWDVLDLMQQSTSDLCWAFNNHNVFVEDQDY